MPSSRLTCLTCDMSIPYTVISTGSQGNAVVVNDTVLIDCGVPYKAIKPYVRNLKLVLLTHIHGDHFNPTALRILHRERPTLRFGCGRWLVAPLLEAGVSAANIDILKDSIIYGYGICNVIPVPLVHDVPNYGYKVHFQIGKVFYATDTNNLNGISAPNYDLYLVEANYTDEEIKQRIAEKKENGEYAYEKRVLQYHLSKAKCDDFIYRNCKPTSEYAYLHCHVDRSQDEPKGDKHVL